METNALHKIGYGMYIVGSHKDTKLNGQIANTVFQITSEPPTIAVSINKNNLTHEYIRDSKVLSVSILSQAAPLPFIGGFGFKSGRDTDKMKNVNYRLGQTGSPIILDNTTAYLEAEITQDIDVGTHTVFIGKVVAAEILNDESCLTYEYYHQVKRGVTPKTAPSYIAKEK
jgi:ferric-chelate reductase [NAD(P)H]